MIFLERVNVRWDKRRNGRDSVECKFKVDILLKNLIAPVKRKIDNLCKK